MSSLIQQLIAGRSPLFLKNTSTNHFQFGFCVSIIRRICVIFQKLDHLSRLLHGDLILILSTLHSLCGYLVSIERRRATVYSRTCKCHFLQFEFSCLHWLIFRSHFYSIDLLTSFSSGGLELASLIVCFKCWCIVSNLELLVGWYCYRFPSCIKRCHSWLNEIKGEKRVTLYDSMFNLLYCS